MTPTQPTSFQQKAPNDPLVGSPLKETPEILGVAIRQLEDAIAMMPDNCSYRTAYSKCPDLVATESNPVRFLRCCAYNTWDTAQRLVAYWKLRLEVFGPDRCYRSLNDFSGNGALPEKALQVVETGCVYLLPPDQKGRSVLLSDRSKFPQKVQEKIGCTLEMKQQAAFYNLHTVSQQPATATTGFICLQIVITKQLKMYPSVGRFFAKACREAFPIKLQSVHVVCAPPFNPKKPSLFADTLLPFLWQMMKQYFVNTRRTLDLVVPEPDAADNTKLAKAKLAKLLTNKIGLDPDALPPFAGGTWSFVRYKRYKRWHETQQKVTANAVATVVLPIVGGSSVASTTVPNPVLQSLPLDLFVKAAIEASESTAAAAVTDVSEDGEESDNFVSSNRKRIRVDDTGLAAQPQSKK